MDRVVPRRVQNRAARFCPSATVTDAMLSADLGRVRAACFGHATRIARRNPLFWHAVAHQPDLKAQGYGFWRDRELVAYLIFALAGNRLVVSDYAAIDAEAMQDVIALISSFGTICERLEWVGAPGDPMHGGLQDVRVIILECQPAMVRLLDVPRHLSDRRYPASISLKTRFNVQDRLLPSNEGCYELDVSGGRAALRMDRGTLAEDVPTVEIGALSAMALAGGCASRTSGGARAAEELAAIECLFAHQCGHMPERDLF
jgi:predicted acetyltransferase